MVCARPAPAELTARTATTSHAPGVPETPMDVREVGTQEPFPTRYSYVTRASPPRSLGIAQATCTAPFEGVALKFLTEPGFVTSLLGVTLALGAEAGESPAALMALTVKV